MSDPVSPPNTPPSSASPSALRKLLTTAAMVVAGPFGSCGVGEAATVIDAPVVDEQAGPVPTSDHETTVLAGGCFWGVQAVFQHVKGVISAESGYAGGNPAMTNYEAVSSGVTGHAEAVKVVFDPKEITYGRLLRIFFSVAHDPTQLNRQGPDSGTQYRSAIFTTSDSQRHIAQSYVAQLDGAKFFAKPIVTQILPLQAFYPAESYHQDYATLHPNNPYIAYNDLPKVAQLKELFPDFYRVEPALMQTPSVPRKGP